jgi:polysaccharide export outer membrane protein
MRSNSTTRTQTDRFDRIAEKTRRGGLQLGLGGFVIAALVLSTGCQNQSPSISASNAEAIQQSIGQQKSETLTLREGDVIKISIPGAPNLDTVQTIRRDGKIALALVGEVQAAGLKPAEVQADLLRLYAPQLVSKEVIVSVVSSSFPTFVSGAVLHPGKVVSDRPITALEAIMEAGGPDYAKANLKAVVVIRQEADGKTHNYTVDLKSVMEGKQVEPFFLKPSDIVYVPERFAWF